MPDPIEGSEHPVDRLTRVLEGVAENIEAHPDYRKGDRAILLMDDDHFGGICIHGYEPEEAALLLTNFYRHLEVMARRCGIDIDLIAASEPNQG